MQRPNTQLTCPRCHQQFSAVIEQLIDTRRNPQAKSRLLAGYLNVVTCPNCGTQLPIGTPLVYHDPEKQLLMTYVPMELGLPKQEQERVIGSMVTAITNSLPVEQRKGYLLTPRTALTMQGMIDTILEFDGVTREMLDAQREKVKLLETLLQTPPEQLPAAIQAADAQITPEFLTLVEATVATMSENGNEAVADEISVVYEQILDHSTVGKQRLDELGDQQKVIEEINREIRALGDRPTREGLLDVLIKIAGDDPAKNDQKVEVAVSALYPALDYQTIEALTKRVDAAKGADRKRLLALRNRVVDLIAEINKENDTVVREVNDVLTAIVNSEDVDAAVEEYLPQISQLVLEALSINIEKAEKEKNTALFQRLQYVSERITARIRSDLPPEMMFIEELLNQPSFDDAKAMLKARASEFGPRLPDMLEVLIQDFMQRGGPEQQPLIAQLQQILVEARKALAEQPALSEAATSQPAALQSEAPAPKTDLPRPTLLRSGRSEPPASQSSAPADKPQPKIEILRGGKYTPLPPRDSKK